MAPGEHECCADNACRADDGGPPVGVLNELEDDLGDPVEGDIEEVKHSVDHSQRRSPHRDEARVNRSQIVTGRESEAGT